MDVLRALPRVSRRVQLLLALTLTLTDGGFAHDGRTGQRRHP
jgi:hypothetical protein